MKKLKIMKKNLKKLVAKSKNLFFYQVTKQIFLFKIILKK